MPKQQVPEIPVRFYRTVSGGEPVLEWLRTLDKEDRRIIGIDLMRVQFGWPIGMPLVRSLKNGLWEVRSNLASQRIARLLLCFHQETLVVLHGFIKKSQKTAPADLAMAIRRMKEVTK
jgi:phage-related protein